MKRLDDAIKAVIDSPSLSSLQGSGFLPNVSFRDDFFFISYSHKDYKEVYVDLLRLEDIGLSFWYDRGMVPGKDWSDTAELYLSKFHCRGVLLYVSRASLSSNAVATEILKAGQYGKPIIPILIQEGEKRTLVQMVEEFAPEKTKAFLHEALPDTLLYVELEASTPDKREKIELAKDQGDAYSYKLYYDFQTSMDALCYTVESASDFEAKSAELPILLEEGQPLVGVEQATFANFPNLQKVTGPAFRYIFDYAFFHCPKLTSITIDRHAYIGRYAFANCHGLEEVIAKDLNLKAPTDYVLPFRETELHVNGISKEEGGYIGDFAFANCFALTRVDISVKTKHLGKACFHNCRFLESIRLPGTLEEIGEYAFAGCESLEEIVIPDSVKRIGKGAFSNCRSLERVRLPKGLTTLDESVFAYCFTLREIVIDLSSLKEIKFDALGSCPNLHLDLSEYKGKCHEQACSGSPKIILSKE